jgi:hypothetical protein
MQPPKIPPKGGPIAVPPFFFFPLVVAVDELVNDVIVVVANPIPPGPRLIVWPL